MYLQTVVSVSQHYKNPTKCVDLVQRGRYYHNQGRIQYFKLGGGAHLKKLRRAEGGAKMFGVFRVKNHDFTPKNHIFPNLGGAREIFGVFHVKNHDFTPKKIIFSNFRGGRAPGALPLDPPLQ